MEQRNDEAEIVGHKTADERALWAEWTAKAKGKGRCLAREAKVEARGEGASGRDWCVCECFRLLSSISSLGLDSLSRADSATPQTNKKMQLPECKAGLEKPGKYLTSDC